MKLKELLNKLNKANTEVNAGELEVKLYVEFEGAFIHKTKITDITFQDGELAIWSEED